jgi:hypothetical protein
MASVLTIAALAALPVVVPIALAKFRKNALSHSRFRRKRKN